MAVVGSVQVAFELEEFEQAVFVLAVFELEDSVQAVFALVDSDLVKFALAEFVAVVELVRHKSWHLY